MRILLENNIRKGDMRKEEMGDSNESLAIGDI